MPVEEHRPEYEYFAGLARRRARKAAAWSGLLIMCTACGSQPDPAKTLDSISSELATAALAGNAWAVHSTPTAFTRNTLLKARHAIADEQTLLFTQAVPSVDTAALRTSLESAKNTIATMERLLNRGDAEAFSARLATLKADANRVKKMSDSLDQSQ